jgi:hypothetical protein
MSLLNSAGKFSVLEIVLLLAFVVYIIFPIPTPDSIRPLIDSPLGIVGIFLITVSLFLYTSPLIGIVYIFVAYELLRRSAAPAIPAVQRRERNDRMTEYMPTHIPKSIPTQAEKDVELQNLNPSSPTTLEEEIVHIRAPIGRSDPVKYTESSFKPVADNTLGASMYM